MSPARCAVVFDWNGTLLADTALTVRAMNETLSLFRIQPISIDDYRTHHSVPFDKMYIQLGCDKDEILARQKEIFETFGTHYEGKASTLRQRRGAERVLKTLKDRGHKTAILSNYTVERISPQAQRLGLLQYFDDVLANRSSYQDIFHKKTKGERLKAFVAQHDTDKALVVGDTIEEIEIAQDYGFLSVAIENGACSSARLRAAKPDFLIGSLEQIPAIAAKVFGQGGAR